MRKNTDVGIILLLFFFWIGCQDNSPDQVAPSESQHAAPSYTSDRIPEYRKKIQGEPVAAYQEKINDPLNNWFFSVQLFETSKTFQYRIKLQYEELRGEDTLNLPNFGSFPKPALEKGKENHSCIIGFMDRDNKFREYKMVSVPEGKEIRITTLKHYGISRFPDDP